MPSINFFGQNFHFAVCLFAGFVFFAIFWLYFDAWVTKRQSKEILGWAGFLIVAVSFLLSATVTEQSVMGYSALADGLQTASYIVRAIGLAFIVIGQLVVPLQARPKMKGIDKKLFAKEEPAKARSVSTVSTVGLSSFANPFHALLPIGALGVAALYWRRATTGLEKHLKPVAVAFGFVFIYELLSLASFWQNSSNPSLSKLVAAFGWLWFVDHIFLLAGLIILVRWVWQYLTERFMSQLFMVFTSVTLVIFLVTTVTFTFLLVNNVQKSTLDNLETAANVLNYAVSNKKSETLAKVQAVAANPYVVDALLAKDHDCLTSLTSTYLVEQRQSSLVIVNASGEVLLRAEDPANWGDSISSDTLLQRVLIGQSSSSIVSLEGVLAPVLYIKSATPIYNSQQQIVGAAIGSLAIDNAFVDGIKHSTGLDSSVYSGDTLSATTFLQPDSQSRAIGVKEAHTNIKSTVLEQGQVYKGLTFVLNRQYQVVFTPLKDVDNEVIGMLFLGQSRDNVLKTAGHSIELTFVVTAILVALSILPAYKIAKSIGRQVA